jgi:DNA-binding CsgD family transcriptional regulator
LSGGAPLVIGLRLGDGVLQDRLAELLAGVPGLRIAGPGEAADAILVPPRPASAQEAALTPREAEVLALMAEGATNKGIARRLGISVSTAKFHVASVLDKLEAGSRTDAVALGMRLGVLDL